VKKFLHFSVKNKKLFERSEFFLFRKNVKILASERQPALFLFVSFSFVRTKGKRKTLRLEQKNFNYQNLSFTYLFFLSQKEKVNPCQNILWAG
jgi:hypothetical protein